MIVGTTPTHTFNLKISTDNILKVRIVYAQDDNVLFVKTLDNGVSLEDKAIIVKLTQQDTFLIDHNKPVEIQIRALSKNGTALSTIPIKKSAIKCLESEVIK